MPDGWGIMKVLGKLVGISSTSEFESCTTGRTTANVPYSPKTMRVSDSAPCCVLLDLLGGIQASERRGIHSRIDGEKNKIDKV